MRSSCMICVGLGLVLFVLFPLGIPPLQSDWSLSCDHGRDNHSNIAPHLFRSVSQVALKVGSLADATAVPHAAIRPHAYTVYGKI